MKKAKTAFGFIIVVIAIILLVPILAEADSKLRINLAPEGEGMTAIKVFENDNQTGYIQNFARGTYYDFPLKDGDSSITLQVHQGAQPWCNTVGGSGGGSPIAGGTTEVTITVPTDAPSCTLTLPEPPPPVCPDPNNPECPVCEVPNVPNYPGYEPLCPVACPDQNVPGGDQGYFPDSPECPINCPVENNPNNPDFNPDCPHCPDKDNPSCPIAIGSCNDLSFILNDLTKHYILTDNISCGGSNLATAGLFNKTFSGILDGNGKTLSHFDIDVIDSGTQEFVGLFGKLQGATIKNLILGNVIFKSNVTTTRGLIAGSAKDSVLEDIYVYGNFYMTGFNDEAKPLGAASGGLLGIADNVQLTRVRVDNPTIEKNAYAGGLVGIAKNGTTITRSSVRNLNIWHTLCRDSTVNGIWPCGSGGMIGLIDTGTPVKISESFVGAPSHDSTAVGALTPVNAVGGLVGYIKPNVEVSIDNSYATINVHTSGKEAVATGGLIGLIENPYGAYVTLNNTYSAGTVGSYIKCHRTSFVGVEFNGQCLATKRVAGSGNFNDVEKAYGMLSGVEESPVELQGLNTSAMKNPGNFSNWNTQIWKLESGKYPALLHNQ
jgi:hypothetical protein